MAGTKVAEVPPAPEGRLIDRIAESGHPTVRERATVGKVARRAVPREQHAAVSGEPLDAVAVLGADDHRRVPELLPIRYGRMLASPFAFFRGAAAVMAADLAEVPNSGLRAQLCGDAHLSNFGVYATPERRLVFDVNDFDETLPGPFEWDVKRLAASLALAGRGNGHKRSDRQKTLLATVGTYRSAMREFAEMGNLAVWYASLDIERALADLAPRTTATDRRRTRAALERARSRDSRDALRKLTRLENGQARFIHAPPLIVPLADLLSEVDAGQMRMSLLEILESYRDTLVEDRRSLLDQFQLVDIARKVVGVGSVGTRAWVLLLIGRDDKDPLVLQAKEARESVLEPYCGPSAYSNAGHRVVAGQRLVQASSDIFLGWHRGEGIDGQVRDFYVRQLRDGKASADIEGMGPRRLTLYGELCAWTLARAHARSGDRLAIAAYLGKSDAFDHAIAEFAESYADRTEQQHRQLQDAVETGAVAATRGV
jgi:uncharacterized protein (DUF2252 family)